MNKNTFRDYPKFLYLSTISYIFLIFILPSIALAQTHTPPPLTTSGYAAREDVQQWATELAQTENIPQDYIISIMSKARYNAAVANAIIPPSQPSAKDWSKYQAQFLNRDRIKAGLHFWKIHETTLNQVSEQYGVPPEIIASIIGIETYYGKFMGKFRTLDALATLGFDYPSHAPKDRSDYFKAELGNFLALTHEKNQNPLKIKGSYAGAVGLPQFMPSSQRKYAVSSTNKESFDLINNPDDAIASVANFLVAHGWKRGSPVFISVKLPDHASELVQGGIAPYLSKQDILAHQIMPDPDTELPDDIQYGVIDLVGQAPIRTEYRLAGHNFFIITQYNRSYFYATAVYDFAQALKDGHTTPIVH